MPKLWQARSSIGRVRVLFGLWKIQGIRWKPVNPANTVGRGITTKRSVT
jgi:hypothetical protein